MGPTSGTDVRAPEQLHLADELEQLLVADAAHAASDIRRRRLLTTAGAVVLLATSTLLWLPGFRQWYWIDEALSLGIVRHSLREIPGLLIIDGSPPGWYLVAHVWTSLVGTSEGATRLLSFSFAIACIPAAWFAGKKLFDERVAAMGAVLVGLSPFLGYFARETRMYTMVVLLSLFVTATFVRAFVDGSRPAAFGFVAALSGLLYTHNWGLYTAVACAASLVPVALYVDDRRSLLRRAALCFGAVGAIYLPWVPTLLGQLRDTGAPWAYTPTARETVREVAALIRDERVLIALGLPAFIGLLPLFRRLRSRAATVCMVLVLLATVPIVIGWLTAHIEPSWATRYLAVAVGPLLLLLAVGVARAGTTGVVGLVIAAAILTQPFSRVEGGIQWPNDSKTSGPAVLAKLQPKLAPGDLVIVAQPEAVPQVRLYLGPEFSYASVLGPVDDPELMDWRHADARLQSASVAGQLQPLLDAAEPGDRIAIVRPGDKNRRTDTIWLKTFRAKGRVWERALRDDTRFRLVSAVRGKDSRPSPLDAMVFERVDPSA